MDGQDVEVYLQSFGEELKGRGFQDPIDILIVGGVHMVMHVENRPSTEDIDFRFLSDGLDLTKLPLTKQEKIFRAAINAVAKSHGLPRHWLNDDAGPFVEEYVEEPVRTFWRSFGPLQVYFTDNATMLVYKLMGYSPKQKPDVYALAEVLEISTYTQVKALVDQLVLPETQAEYEVEYTIRLLFK
ncbi:hypothetical protein [Dictyobacter arantiisoli]|uniref:Uncharacterized protein n=1 Tax=Dictyobacter arantiisoli TaxID=2014874 RepID=A0A5A5TLQ5_9CHLR|nr:hypothetical protein [Dictyobacter arantiisoli]GCF11994.1 hypothetical protein KDI_55580 [Dictyobacter arantiisoli]